MTCVLGIDPGISGAIAFYFIDAPDRVAVEDVPVADGSISASILASRIAAFDPAIGIIERVAARPGQGVSSMFKFGASFGIACGVVGALKIPVYFVTPAKWKKHFCLSSDKDEARARALELFPACALSFARKKDHGRAEAALIAKYGAEMLLPFLALNGTAA